MSAEAPDERRVDPSQLRALVRLSLKQGLGRGVDPNTGSKGNPMLQVLFSMTALGAMLSTNASRAADLPSFLVVVFATVFVIVLLAINPDAQDVQERRLEILGSKPIAPRTFLSARALLLLALSSLLAGCLGLAPLVMALVRFPFAWPRAAATYLMLVLGSFTVAVLWLAAVMVGLRWLSVDRVRKTSQFLLLVAILGVSAASVGWIPVHLPGGKFSISTWPQALLPPSSWFALFWLDDPLPGALSRRAGAILLLGTAVLVALGGVLSRYYADFAEQSVAKGGRSPRSALVWALERITRLPGAGRHVLPPPVLAVAAAVLTTTRREDVSRAKTLAPQVLALVAFAVAWTGAEPLVMLTMLTYLGFSAVVEGLQVTRQSSHPAAGWIFWAAPVDPRHVVRGLTLALTLRFLVLPAVLLALILFRLHPPALAGVLSLAYVLSARLLIPLGLALWPALPLSHDQRSAQSFFGFVLAFVLTVVFAVAQAVIVMLTPLFGVIAVALAAAMLVALAGAAWGLGWSAAQRVARLEYPH